MSHCNCCLCVPKSKKCDVCYIIYTNKKYFYKTRLFKLYFPQEKRQVCRSCGEQMIDEGVPLVKINTSETIVTFD